MLRCIRLRFPFAVLTPLVYVALSFPLPRPGTGCICFMLQLPTHMKGISTYMKYMQHGAAPCLLSLKISREGRAEMAQQLHFGLLFYLLLEAPFMQFTDLF